MSKHTPGPWSANLNPHESTGGSIQGLGDSDDYIVHICNDPERERANARLIAKAPEMLEALRVAASYLGDDATDDSPEAREARAAVRAAIAKVEG